LRALCGYFRDFGAIWERFHNSLTKEGQLLFAASRRRQIMVRVGRMLDEKRSIREMVSSLSIELADIGCLKMRRVSVTSQVVPETGFALDRDLIRAGPTANGPPVSLSARVWGSRLDRASTRRSPSKRLPIQYSVYSRPNGLEAIIPSS